MKGLLLKASLFYFLLVAKFHFMLFQHRRLSYSRHTVDDRDLSTQVQFTTYYKPLKDEELIIIFFTAS